MSSRKQTAVQSGGRSPTDPVIQQEYHKAAEDNTALNKSLEDVSKALDDAVKRSDEAIQASSATRSRSHSRGRSPSPSKTGVPGHPGDRTQSRPYSPLGGEATPGMSGMDLLDEIREQRGMPKRDFTTSVGHTSENDRGRSKDREKHSKESQGPSGLLSTVLQYGEKPRQVVKTTDSGRKKNQPKGTALGEMLLQYGGRPKDKPPSGHPEKQDGRSLYQNLPQLSTTQPRGSGEKHDAAGTKPNYANLFLQYGSTPKETPKLVDDDTFVRTTGTVASELRSYSIKKSNIKRGKEAKDGQVEIREIGRPVSNTIDRQSSSLSGATSKGEHLYQDIGEYQNLTEFGFEVPIGAHPGDVSKLSLDAARGNQDGTNLSARYGEAYDSMEDVDAGSKWG